MTSRYNAFDFINSPIIVFGPTGETVFENIHYKRKVKNADFKGFDVNPECDQSMIFSQEEGEVKCYLISSDSDETGNRICIFKDITPFVSRKSMTEIMASKEGDKNGYAGRKIAEKNSRMASLIDSLDSGILLEGASGSLIQTNNCFLKMISPAGITALPKDDYGADFYHDILAELVEGDSYHALKDRIIKENREGVYSDTVRFKNGRIYTRTFRQLFVEGKPKGYLWKFKDVTENRLLRIDLEKNESRFRNIFERNMAVMLIFDPATLRIINANTSAEKFYGKSTNELKQLSMCDITIVGNMNECMSKLSEITSRKTGMVITAHQKIADGSIRDVELLMTPISEEEGGLLFVIVNDVYERVKYENALENLNANLIDMVEKESVKRRRQEELLMEKSRLAEMGEMIGNIAHQWRQPLNALGFIIQDLSDAYNYDEITAEYVQEIIRNGMEQINYMSKTIDDFRDFFKPSSKETVFDVKESIGQVLSLFLPQVKNNGIDLFVACRCAYREAEQKNTDKLEFCDDHCLQIKGYSSQFKQVLLNLLANSRHAVRKTEEKKIKIVINESGGRIQIMVEDTGGGIPEEIIDRIFDPYFTTKSDEGGTGIGLYMSRAIIEENLGGSLRAENIRGGCRITIEVDQVRT